MRHPFDRSGEPEAKVSEESSRPRRHLVRVLFFSTCLAAGLTIAAPASAKSHLAGWWKGRSFTQNPVAAKARNPRARPSVKPRAVGKLPAHGAVVRPVPPGMKKKPVPPSK